MPWFWKRKFNMGWYCYHRKYNFRELPRRLSTKGKQLPEIRSHCPNTNTVLEDWHGRRGKDRPNQFIVTSSTLNFILFWNTYLLFCTPFQGNSLTLWKSPQISMKEKHYSKISVFKATDHIPRRYACLSVCVYIYVTVLCSVCVGERSRKLATQLTHWWLKLT